MGKRTTGRRLAMQALYQTDLSGVSAKDALLSVSSEEKFPRETIDFAENLLESVITNKVRIDGEISKNLDAWQIQRLSVVDKNILRVAVCEMISDGKTPYSAIINEAVELAKKFGGTESKKFINGVLSSVAKSLKL
jgi:N utilization substance protein B